MNKIYLFEIGQPRQKQLYNLELHNTNKDTYRMSLFCKKNHTMYIYSIGVKVMYKVPSDKRDRLLKSEFLIKQFKVERLEAF